MERVTFQDKKLVEKIKASCVCTWQNVFPGYETTRGSATVTASMARCPPGTASANVATIFSTGDGKVLHIAPGLLSPEDLARELDFALSVDRAVKEAGENAAARARAFVAAHDARRAELAEAKGLDLDWKVMLTQVHKVLRSRPMVAREALQLSDYFPTVDKRT